MQTDIRTYLLVSIWVWDDAKSHFEEMFHSRRSGDFDFVSQCDNVFLGWLEINSVIQINYNSEINYIHLSGFAKRIITVCLLQFISSRSLCVTWTCFKRLTPAAVLLGHADIWRRVKQSHEKCCFSQGTLVCTFPFWIQTASPRPIQYGVKLQKKIKTRRASLFIWLRWMVHQRTVITGECEWKDAGEVKMRTLTFANVTVQTGAGGNQMWHVNYKGL